jgi:hypothetical protein
LLPLLWDGEHFSRHAKHKLGRAIIICSVSSYDLIEYATHPTEEKIRIAAEEKFSKATDFISRFNGGVIQLRSINEPARECDKICIGIRLVQQRFQIDEIQRAFLCLLRHVDFVHEVRSLQTLINAFSDKAGTHKACFKLIDGNHDYFSDLLKDTVAGALLLKAHIKQQGRDLERIWTSSVRIGCGTDVDKPIAVK